MNKLKQIWNWFINLFRTRNKEREELIAVWVNAFTTVIKEAVPDEEFVITGKDELTSISFTIHTESKRAMIAFSEFQELFSNPPPSQEDLFADFDDHS